MAFPFVPAPASVHSSSAAAATSAGRSSRSCFADESTETSAASGVRPVRVTTFAIVRRVMGVST